MLPSTDEGPRFPVGDVRKKEYWPRSAAFDAGCDITVVAWALFVLSATDVAVIVTVTSVAEEAGAVKVVETSLLVVAGLKEPHSEMGVQLHSTPPCGTSLATVAVSATLWPGWMAEGGPAVIVTDIVSGVTGGGILDPLPRPPHPTPAIIVAKAAKRTESR
jgi:hypothetical protein